MLCAFSAGWSACRRLPFRRSLRCLRCLRALASCLPVLPLLLLAACEAPVYRHSGVSMSSALNVLVSAGAEPDWKALYDYADAEAALYDWRLPEGPLGRLNRGEALVPPPELGATLVVALQAARASGGAFDPTILPLTRLWSFDTGGRLPSEAEIQQARRFVDWRRIQVDSSGRTSLPPGFGLDLGGIAQGAVVDLLGAYLEKQGRHDWLVEASGDILISGLKRGKDPWTVAIRHPRKSDAYVGIVKLGQKGRKLGIVTSGDYERFFEKDGVRYHHILDPATGYPARGLISVTIIAPTCTQADVLSTTVLVLGREKGLALLDSWGGVEGLLIGETPSGLRAWATPGFPLKPGQLKL
jgi:thiamine biosynthesis lipoprotein